IEQLHPGILGAASENGRKRPMRPGDNLRNDLRDNDPGVSTEVPERRSKRKAHPQSADEYLWFGFGRDAPGNEFGEGFFRAASAPVHDRARPQHDRECFAPLLETPLGCSAWNIGAVEADPRYHEKPPAVSGAAARCPPYNTSFLV